MPELATRLSCEVRDYTKRLLLVDLRARIRPTNQDKGERMSEYASDTRADRRVAQLKGEWERIPEEEQEACMTSFRTRNTGDSVFLNFCEL